MYAGGKDSAEQECAESSLRDQGKQQFTEEWTEARKNKLFMSESQFK